MRKTKTPILDAAHAAPPVDTGVSVPHIDEASGIHDLNQHYLSRGGKITCAGSGFHVRLVAQKRIHFYEYDDYFPRPNPILGRRALKSFVFKSEGFYDEHSRYWMPGVH